MIFFNSLFFYFLKKKKVKNLSLIKVKHMNVLTLYLHLILLINNFKYNMTIFQFNSKYFVIISLYLFKGEKILILLL